MRIESGTPIWWPATDMYWQHAKFFHERKRAMSDKRRYIPNLHWKHSGVELHNAVINMRRNEVWLNNQRVAKGVSARWGDQSSASMTRHARNDITQLKKKQWCKPVLRARVQFCYSADPFLLPIQQRTSAPGHATKILQLCETRPVRNPHGSKYPTLCYATGQV